jgi:peptidoglycan hydrolase-like protein with peptidoglycan-binding domain
MVAAGEQTVATREQHLESEGLEQAPPAEPERSARAQPLPVAYAIAAGSASMARYALARQPAPPLAPPAAGALSDAQATDAVAWTNRKYDELSVGVIQHIAAVPADRVFTEATAQAVATFQQTNGLLVDGKVGHQTLTAAFPERVGQNGHDQLVHIVADLCEIDITSTTSAVRFDQTVAVRGQSEFDPSGLRVIKLGAPAFQSSRILRDTLKAQLLTRPPAAAAAGPAPATIDPADAALALIVDQVALSHPHSIQAVSVLVGGPRLQAWDADMVQRLAAFQAAAGVTANGLVNVATVEQLVASLIAAGDNNGAIRVIVDFFSFDDMANLVSIYFDPNETANAETLPLSSGEENQPASIQVGPAGMAQSFPGLVHTIEHEFSHVRLMRQNETDIPTQEFLSEAVEMTSTLTPQEDIAGFMNDADRGEAQWQRMPLDRQIRHRDRFVEVREEVRRRHAASTPAEQATNQPIVDRWNNVALPVGPPGP